MIRVVREQRRVREHRRRISMVARPLTLPATGARLASDSSNATSTQQLVALQEAVGKALLAS
jgi:hypothetical protein